MVDERIVQNGWKEITRETSETAENGEYSRAAKQYHEKAFVPIASAGHIGWQALHEPAPQQQEDQLPCVPKMETGDLDALSTPDHASHLGRTSDHTHTGINFDVGQARWAQFRCQSACANLHP